MPALYREPRCKFPKVAFPEQVKVLIAALPETVRPPVTVVASLCTLKRSALFIKTLNWLQQKQHQMELLGA